MKDDLIRIALAQINCTVGDLEGNARKIKEYVQKAKDASADIIAFPELAVTGYPPEDLLLKPKFIKDNLSAIKELAKGIHGIVAVVGFVDKQGKDIFNAAAVMYSGVIKGVYHKTLLPNYGVFDEKRYFTPGSAQPVFKLGKVIFGVNICEDVWSFNGPIKQESSLGAKLIININASPYHTGKTKNREAVMTRQAKANRLVIAYANLVGGQDELVFDGQSMVVDGAGKIVARSEAFKEDLLLTDVAITRQASKKKKKSIVTVAETFSSKGRDVLPKRTIRPLEAAAEIYEALKLGLKDYVAKNGFQKAVMGISGGIDSALVAAIAVDALGKDNVTAVFMPSRYSSKASEDDATAVAKNLGIPFMNISIDALYKMYLLILEQHFAGFDKNIAEENVQARIRGNILMALSNKFGWLVLTTGNKSEMSTGYATLYGDMAGGFAVIKDVPKMLVYKIARYRNSVALVIPESIFVKAPTAELAPHQKDSDTLPVYETLDPILRAYIEEDKDPDAIVASGFDKEVVRKVLRMVETSEYKRRQAPPGIKITPRAFGKDRRMPITNKYKGG